MVKYKQKNCHKIRGWKCPGLVLFSPAHVLTTKQLPVLSLFVLSEQSYKKLNCEIQQCGFQGSGRS